MKKQHVISTLLLGTWTALLHAAAPIWTFKPLTPTTVTVSNNSMATVRYTVTNQSARPHTLVMKPMVGVQQVQQAPGDCRPFFTLASKGASCSLNLLISGSQLKQELTGGPVVCQQGSLSQCYQPSAADVLNIKPATVKQYTIGGTITGLNGSVTLVNNQANPLIRTTNGQYTFPQTVAQGAAYNVTVANQPANQECKVTNGVGRVNGSNVSNVNVSCIASTPTTLSVTPRAVIPNNQTASITVTNTGDSTAVNVHAILPTDWERVEQNAAGCRTIAPQGTCTLLFSSSNGYAYVAQGNILVTGDNITSPPTIALAFSYTGYLVFAADGGGYDVIDTEDLALAQQWGGFNTAIGPDAQSTTNGAGNTAAIPHTNDYAAGLCYNSHEGDGAWYLPAICQMGANQPNLCAERVDNIANLQQLGFIALSGNYWSSTESNGSLIPSSRGAWLQRFSPIPYIQEIRGKYELLSVRCARYVPAQAFH